jgi:CheY-like chemotaxis protein
MGRAFKYHTAWLIDDNYIDNAIHQKILESCHFAENILVFESAKLAIDHIHRIDSTELTEPIIVFLDLRMPELDGFAFLTELEKLPAAMLSKIKIYVLSSSLDPNDRRKIEKNQLTHYFISKPLTEQVLVKL